jgi:hypothetical protein
VVELFRSGHEKQNKAASGESGTQETMFTGTLIEDLIATVERVEQKTQMDEVILDVELWMTARDSAGYESEFLGVA